MEIPNQPTAEEKQEAAVQLLQEGFQRSADFLNSYLTQPDHVAVIIAASKMDELLTYAIRQRLRPCPSKSDDLLDSERGIGTFSNKIMFAHRLGVICPNMARALHLFRKIRNDFAHAHEGQSLSSPPHRDRVDELNAKLDLMPGLVNLRKQLSAAGQPTVKKVSFIVAATFVITRLESIKPLLKPVDDELANYAKFP